MKTMRKIIDEQTTKMQEKKKWRITERGEDKSGWRGEQKKALQEEQERR